METISKQILELQEKSELTKSERRRLSRLQKKAELLEVQQEEEKAQYNRDIYYMKEAIRQAKKAAVLNEVPIGCVIVKDDVIISRGYNRRNTDHSTLSHAEISAIRKASRKLNDWRLEDCTLYVTLEPCQMCAGAIVQARIKRVVVGSMNPKAGCAGSVLNILQMKEFNHQVELSTGIMREECSELLKAFFRKLR
ncbi:MAG: tRNA adenosine(34) deaminase TadA [Lachnospiraceae bacterium]|nr:tRNA adenosine(34) deaminase TadA [Lachnospiraceae bacterium]